jgi:hypothetical protein
MERYTLQCGNITTYQSLNMALNGDIIISNMAENMMSDTENLPVKRGGRASLISDACLWGDRDSLLFLLETTWADVGAKLQAAKTADDVLVALQIWKGRNESPVVKTLLRPESMAASAKALTEKRRRHRELIEHSRNAWEQQEKCREAVEVAQRALNSQLSDRDRTAVEKRLAQRQEKFDRAKAEHDFADSRERRMNQQLQESETHFARTEAVQFLRSPRYRKTPLNTANAFAGLPNMGWRQSIQRCMKGEAVGANGGAIQVFNTIKRIVDSCTRPSQLASHAEQWLKTQKGSKSLGVSELRKEFYYLQSAINTVLETEPKVRRNTVLETEPKVRRRELPYAIAKEYREHKSHPSDVDRLFAEDEAL